MDPNRLGHVLVSPQHLRGLCWRCATCKTTWREFSDQTRAVSNRNTSDTIGLRNLASFPFPHRETSSKGNPRSRRAVGNHVQKGNPSKKSLSLLRDQPRSLSQQMVHHGRLTQPQDGHRVQSLNLVGFHLSDVPKEVSEPLQIGRYKSEGTFQRNLYGVTLLDQKDQAKRLQHSYQIPSDSILFNSQRRQRVRRYLVRLVRKGQAPIKHPQAQSVYFRAHEDAVSKLEGNSHMPNVPHSSSSLSTLRLVHGLNSTKALAYDGKRRDQRGFATYCVSLLS